MTATVHQGIVAGLVFDVVQLKLSMSAAQHRAFSGSAGEFTA
jgi:hypothetical protein